MPAASSGVSAVSELGSFVLDVIEDEERFEVLGAAARVGSLRGYRATRVDEMRARWLIDGCLINDRVLRNRNWHRIQKWEVAD